MQGWSASRPALKRNSFLLVGRINRPAMPGNWASLLNWRVRQTVVDQKRCAFRRKDCSPPEDGDLERHHGIEQRATALRAVEIRKRRIQLRWNVSKSTAPQKTSS
jgi:hypothetical protein